MSKHSLIIVLQVAPVVSLGIERLETDTLVLQCYQTLTGIKFVITATPGTTDLKAVLQNVYEIYSDYVLKVYFDLPLYLFKLLYTTDMSPYYRILFTRWRCPFAVIYSINTSIRWFRGVSTIRRDELHKVAKSPSNGKRKTICVYILICS